MWGFHSRPAAAFLTRFAKSKVARRDFLAKRAAAVAIQSLVRGHQDRARNKRVEIKEDDEDDDGLLIEDLMMHFSKLGVGFTEAEVKSVNVSNC